MTKNHFELTLLEHIGHVVRMSVSGYRGNGSIIFC